MNISESLGIRTFVYLELSGAGLLFDVLATINEAPTSRASIQLETNPSLNNVQDLEIDFGVLSSSLEGTSMVNLSQYGSLRNEGCTPRNRKPTSE